MGLPKEEERKRVGGMILPWTSLTLARVIVLVRDLVKGTKVVQIEVVPKSGPFSDQEKSKACFFTFSFDLHLRNCSRVIALRFMSFHLSGNAYIRDFHVTSETVATTKLDILTKNKRYIYRLTASYVYLVPSRQDTPHLHKSKHINVTPLDMVVEHLSFTKMRSQLIDNNVNSLATVKQKTKKALLSYSHGTVVPTEIAKYARVALLCQNNK